MMMYQTIAVMISALITASELLAPNKTFCNSQNLFENLMRHESSLLCQFSGLMINGPINNIEWNFFVLGALVIFLLMTVAILWLFQTATFFCGVMWPYKYSVARSSHKIKYLHITAVVISLTIPLVVTVAVHFSDGFGQNGLLSPRCGVLNAKDNFFAFILPINIIVIIGIGLLVLTVWKISHIVSQSIICYLNDITVIL